jgi:hypothetical protein
MLFRGLPCKPTPTQTIKDALWFRPDGRGGGSGYGEGSVLKRRRHTGRVRYIEMFDNTKRKHVRNGMLSPVEFEKREKK